jgi:uncharacterized membrane protein YedE/YeeE
MMQSILLALLGGALIGAAASLMLLFNGRVTGISGILNLCLTTPLREGPWRGAFLLGLILGGAALNWDHPEFFLNTSGRSNMAIAIAGLFVGFGTVLGSGCTSGHGVCGIARLSWRSMVATFIFMAGGVLIASFFQMLGGV